MFIEHKETHPEVAELEKMHDAAQALELDIAGIFSNAGLSIETYGTYQNFYSLIRIRVLTERATEEEHDFVPVMLTALRNAINEHTKVTE